MNQFKTDVITGLQYELQGDYYVIAGEGDERPTVGIWGQRHLRWLRENRRVTYTSLLTTGRLYDYLQDIDVQASEQLELLIRQMAKVEGVTEQMKAKNQVEWVGGMNNIRSRAEEIVMREIVSI